MNLYIAIIICDACKAASVKSVGEEHIEDALDFARDQAVRSGWSHGTGGWFCALCIAEAISKKGQTT